MTPCGTRAATGEAVFTSIRPTLGADGWGYTVPDDLAAAVWDELEWNAAEKEITTAGRFRRWGTSAPSTPLTSV